MQTTEKPHNKQLKKQSKTTQSTSRQTKAVKNYYI